MDKKIEMSYDDAMKKLELVVEKLENGKNTLEEDIKLYNEGIKLCDLCKEKLKKATIEIDDIKE